MVNLIPYLFLVVPWVSVNHMLGFNTLFDNIKLLIDDFLQANEGKSLFEQYRPQTKKDVRRLPFAGAVYEGKKVEVEIAKVFAWSETEDLRVAVTSILKYTENLLRRQHNFKGTVRGVEIMPTWCDVIDHGLKPVSSVQQEVVINPVPIDEDAIIIDLSKASALAAESAQVRERLIVMEDEAGIEEFAQESSHKVDQVLSAGLGFNLERPEDRPDGLLTELEEVYAIIAGDYEAIDLLRELWKSDWQVSLDMAVSILDGVFPYLIEMDHLERIEGGGLIIGHAAEKMVNHYHFYATFESEIACQVREGSREIGTIQSLPAPGDRFRLAGRSWEVLEIDEERRIIQVQLVRGKANAKWMGSGVIIHTRILQRMRQILQETNDYGYLQLRALERLSQVRRLAQSTGLVSKSILPLGGGDFMLVPWQGTRIIHTISLLFKHMGLKVNDVETPYYLNVKADNEKHLRSVIHEIVENVPDPADVVSSLDAYSMFKNKYDRYVPDELLREAYIHDHMDMDTAITVLAEMIG